MTAYTIIPDTSIDGDSVADVALLTALRDNAIAIGEADDTVPPAARVGKTNAQIFTANGTWTKPARLTGNEIIEIEMWGGGGGGDNSGGGGGGGGSYNCRRYLASDLGATETITVGAAGAVGTGGGTSIFGSKFSAYGGAGGSTTGGGGGGTRSGGSGASGGYGYAQTLATAAGADAVGADAGGGGGNVTAGGAAFWGGGGGGDSNNAGGFSTFGGGGGGGNGGGGNAGDSLCGGDGGGSTTNGSVPGGGGGGGSGNAGTGARGEVRVRVLA